MNEVAIFENKDFGSVRVVEQDGEPWFVAKDVATALGYSASSMTNLRVMFQAVPEEWKGRNPITTLNDCVPSCLCDYSWRSKHDL